jgi:glycosyltransferase involved in cell wall biosynthesis
MSNEVIMANIGLDATYLSVYGKGVSRYQHSFIKTLSRLDKTNHYYIFLNRKNIIPLLPQQDNFHYIRVHIPKRIIWDQFQLPWLLMKYKVDIYHSLLDTLPIVGRGRFVMYLFEIPDYRIKFIESQKGNSLYTRISHRYSKFMFPFALRKADIIMVSSCSTKSDLMQNYDIKQEKIHVVYPAADEQFCPAKGEREIVNTRRKYNAEEGYILHLSSSDPRDNTPVVISAYYRMKTQLKTRKKLIIGGDVGSQRQKLGHLIRKFNLQDDVVFTGYLSGEELVVLYQAADLFIDPSLYEGFGFQVIEAMACGIPVITSNLASLPEIVADAGFLVKPTDIDNLASAMVKILTDSGLQRTLRQKSLEKAKSFSWGRTAKETLRIYEEILGAP